MMFDLSSIPAGSTITSATLSLSVTQVSNTTPGAVELHRVLADWGEGTSNSGPSGGSGAPAAAGDATWLHRFFSGTLWANPGGDFAGAASGSTMVGDIGVYSWSGAGLVSDVQSWLNTPSGNFGWLMLGTESAVSSAKRMGSRENTDPAVRPQLTIEYAVPSPGTLLAAAAGSLILT